MVESELLLHPKTRQQIANLTEHLPNALLLIGPVGAGKEQLARNISSQLLGTSLDKLDKQPFFYVVGLEDGKQEIPIESVRQINKNLRLKTNLVRNTPATRVVYIKQADRLSHEAQNALLKNIEEPPFKTVFIFSSTSSRSLLPTIVSRARQISVLPIPLRPAQEFYDNKHDSNQIVSAWSLSQGAAGLMSAILAEDDNHTLKRAVDQTKRFLKLNLYERILMLDGIKQKADMDIWLDGLSRVLKELSKLAIRDDNLRQIDKINRARKLVTFARRDLQRNYNYRLICLNLCLQLEI